MAERSETLLPPRLYRKAQETKAEEKRKLRVAAYCRVSTDSDEQATSYEAQIEHYTMFIQNNPEWTLAGIFAEMKIPKMIQFENANSPKKLEIKVSDTFSVVRSLYFFVP